jgi:hypothetical protein
MLCRGINHLVTQHHIAKSLNPTYRLDTPSLHSFRTELHCSSTGSICTFALKLSYQSIHPTECAMLSFYDLFHFTFHLHNVLFLTTILNNFTSLMHETWWSGGKVCEKDRQHCNTTHSNITQQQHKRHWQQFRKKCWEMTPIITIQSVMHLFNLRTNNWAYRQMCS